MISWIILVRNTCLLSYISKHLYPTIFFFFILWQRWLWTMRAELRALGPPGPALPARSCFFVRYVYARNHWLCLLWRANFPSAASHGAGSLLLSLQLSCSWRNSSLIAGLHVLLSDFTCLGTQHQHYTHFCFSVDEQKNTLFLPIIYNYCSWSLLNTCSLNKYLLLRSWFVSFPGSHQPLPPPAAAHPAPLNAPPRPFFPLLRGAGRGPNGGKQIIYKHVPKKKKKVQTHKCHHKQSLTPFSTRWRKLSAGEAVRTSRATRILRLFTPFFVWLAFFTGS